VLKPSDDEVRTVALEHGMSSIEVMGSPGRVILVAFRDSIKKSGDTTVLSASTWFGEYNPSWSFSILKDDKSFLEYL
jgi:hypothetical protein